MYSFPKELCLRQKTKYKFSSNGLSLELYQQLKLPPYTVKDLSAFAEGLLFSPFKPEIYLHLILIKISSTLNKSVAEIEILCSTKIILYSLK